ncbi:MAG: phosphotransferase family protein [Myxococcota bacterium]
MPTPWQRDLDEDAPKFEQWIRRQMPDATDVKVAGLVAPQSSGFSNETLLFDLSWQEGGEARQEGMVVRIQPTGYQVFPEYDLGLQFETMRLLGPTDVPVPNARWIELEDLSIFGAPFYVMDQVQGRVPTDQPPYHAGGWKTEITPAEREAIFLGGFDCMAKIHRLDVDATGFGFLRRPQLGDTGLDQELAYYEKYFEWAARGKEQPVIQAAHDWLVANKPKDEPESLLWGDARIGNIIFDGTTPAAVLDWEMVGVGSPEADVGWQIFLDRHHSEGIETPRLEGFPSYEDTVAFYEERSGHRVRNLEYYQVFTGYRFGVIMMRIAQQMGHYEVMTPEQSREFELNNTVTRLLAKIMELPPPGELAQKGSLSG